MQRPFMKSSFYRDSRMGVSPSILLGANYDKVSMADQRKREMAKVFKKTSKMIWNGRCEPK